MNYARIEAAYPHLELLDLGARKLLNLTLDWLMQHVDPQVWDDTYKDVFFGDPEEKARRREAAERIKPSDGSGGQLTLKRAEKPEQDPAALGLAIGGKRVSSGPSIGVSEDGEMTVE